MKKLFIATPMFGSQCVGQYTSSLAQLTYDFALKGLPLIWRFEYNNSIISSARNNLVHQFLKTDYDYLLFIDADIEFTTQDVLTLMDWATSRNDIKILAGTYPTKGFPIKYPIKWLDKKTGNQPVKTDGAPTGFMLIKREVFDNFKKAYPEQTYACSTFNEDVTAYFDFKIQNNAYWGEDLMFCNYCKDIKINTWVLPSVKLNHIGNYSFGSSSTSG
jgi:hypothetical protein